MKTILASLIITASVNASIINVDAVNKIQNVQLDMQSIRLINGLSSVDMKSLDSLEAQSNKIAKLVYDGNCASVSINSLPNPECKTIAKKMNSFMIAYNKFSKRIYISKMNSLAAYETKTEKMHACAEAMTSFINSSVEPDALYPINVNVDHEQISDDSIVVNLDIRFLNDAFEKKSAYYNQTIDTFEEYTLKWNASCYDYATYRLSHNRDIVEGRPTVAFVDYLNKIYKNTNLIFGVTRKTDDITVGWKQDVRYEISIVNSNNMVVEKIIASYDFVYSQDKKLKRGINDGETNCDNQKCESVAWLIMPLHQITIMSNVGSKSPNISTNKKKHSPYNFTKASFLLPTDNYTIRVKKI